VVLGIIFSQVTFIVGPAEAAPDEITGTVFEDIAGDGLADGTVGDANNPGVAGVPVSIFRDEAAVQTADSSGDVGQYASIAMQDRTSSLPSLSMRSIETLISSTPPKATISTWRTTHLRSVSLPTR
jgi:hypothetical protein